MNELFRKLFLFVLLLLVFGSTFSQLKYEKESRLKRADIPPLALGFIDSLAIPGKIKWYSEQSLTGTTVEAKFRFNKKKYSLEFDNQGNLQDVEIDIHISEIPENIKQPIFKKLESEFNKYSIQKIQAHYPGSNPEIFVVIKNPQSVTGNTVKYELVINGKTGKIPKQYEMVFDNYGNLSSKKEIIQKNFDNLEF